MDEFTQKHLVAYVARQVPEEYKGEFVSYVKAFFAHDAEACLEKGWGQLWAAYPTRFWE